jgi:hypothetical protein
MNEAMISRRRLLRDSGLGLGVVALAQLLDADCALGAARGAAVPMDLKPRRGPLPVRAKAVIQLVQNGGPSQMDLFDPKPELNKRHGQQFHVKADLQGLGSEANLLMACPFQFRKHGQAGMDFSEVLTHTPSIADDICLVRSMYSEHNNHTEALIMLATGKIFRGRPTLGAWVTYALGSENQNLPAYIVLRDPEGYNTNATLNWDAGWLPALYAGTEFQSQGDPVLNLRPGRPVPDRVQREKLALIGSLNEAHRRKYPAESELETRIRNYELAARMQLSASGVLDISKESQATKRLYGLDNPQTASYARRCLMARRLIEAGVRFVQVFPPIKPSFQPWDSHTSIKAEIPAICAQVEQPAAALVQDLKSRGLLNETLVVWAGEFGRQPVSQNDTGRDHNKQAFALWMAGGGVKPGYIHGGTDEFGYKAIHKPMSVPDLHATILHQLGIDHRKLTYWHNGREESLTDVALTGAHVVGQILNNPVAA